MKTEPLLHDNVNLWFEHPELQEKADFVALPLTDRSNVQIYKHHFLVRNPENFSGPSDIVSVVGFPFGKSAGGTCQYGQQVLLHLK